MKAVDYSIRYYSELNDIDQHVIKEICKSNMLDSIKIYCIKNLFSISLAVTRDILNYQNALLKKELRK